MTWTILIFYLTHPNDSYVVGEFKTQKHCIQAIQARQPPEIKPSVSQCVIVDEQDMSIYKKGYWK